MLVCRRDRCRTLLAAAALAALVFVWRGTTLAADNPNGKIIYEVLPVGNRLHTLDQVRAVMHSRPGIPYEEATVQEDVRRLHATRWFAPGGVQIHTKNEADGRVTILVYLTELASIVHDVQYLGAQHINKTELQSLTGIRKGEPMSPLANELGRQALQRKYQEDGRYYATVELLEGNKPTDTRVIYQIVEGPKVVVSGIDFRGADQASTARLRTQLITKKQFAGLFGGKFNPTSMDLDRQKLIEYYHSLGYLNVQIKSEVEQGAQVGQVRLVYHIDEGQQYHVVGKDIVGNKSFDTERLDSLTELRPGDRYDLRKVRTDMARMKDYYGGRGYLVGVEQRLYEVPGQQGAVQVKYEVQNDKGQPDRVGRIILEGNDVTKARVIYNQLPFRPGQILPYDRIPEAQMRLARLGIFDAEDPPQVDVLPNEWDSVFKDIRVKVKETRTGQFMVGGSFNTDMGLTGNVTINERNFSLTRWPTSWDDVRYGRAFRGDGQELRIELAPGTQFQRYSVTWREPYLLDTPFGLTVSGYYFQRGFAEYNQEVVGTRLTVDRRLDPIWRASLMTRIEGVNISGVPWYAPPSIMDNQGNAFQLGLRPGITRDTRDSYVYPTTGSVFDAGFEQVFGTYSFPIGTVEFSKFFSSRYLAREDGSGKHVLGLRSQFSVAGNDTPVYERFYGGGIRSFRGFTFRGMGPFQNDLAVGGRFAWINTAEYQIPILANDKVHWAFFVDHGTVEQSFEIRNYRVSIGTGLRLNIPALGPLPLALDFAVPLNQGPNDIKQLFSISVGLFGGP